LRADGNRGAARSFSFSFVFIFLPWAIEENDKENE